MFTYNTLKKKLYGNIYLFIYFVQLIQPHAIITQQDTEYVESCIA
jgi:hypothetical protein